MHTPSPAASVPMPEQLTLQGSAQTLLRLKPLLQTYQGVVTMEINKGVNFPKDSSAKIQTAGLLGDQYVGLEPGGDEKNLAAGDVITQTQSAVVLENLIGQFLYNKAADGGEQKAQ